MIQDQDYSRSKGSSSFFRGTRNHLALIPGTSSAGEITNCQIGVFATYVSRHGDAFIDRARNLPKEWTEDPDRLEAVYVPPDVGFATKPKLAARMIVRAIAGSVHFKCVAGDTVYGVGDIEQQLRRARATYWGQQSSRVSILR